MSLISIAQTVTDEVGLPRPVAISSSTDQLARQLLRLANATLNDLASADWPSLVRTSSVVTSVGQTLYDVPIDFKRLVPDTTARQAYGSVTGAEWARFRDYYSSKYVFRFVGNPLKINVSPAPASVESISFDYISNYLVVSDTNVYAAEYTSDTDTSVINENLVYLGLKWRLKHAKGLDYSEDYNEYFTRKNTILAQELAYGSIPVAVRNSDVCTDLEVPENGFGA